MTRPGRITVTRVTGSTLALALALALVLPSGVSPPGASAGSSTALTPILVDELHFDADQVGEWDFGLVPVGGNTSAFGIGGDASNPATLELDDVPWTEPIMLGVNYVRWTDPALVPTFPNGWEVNGTLRGPGALGGPRVDAVYLVGTFIMGDDVPVGFSREYFAQFDLVLDVPGREKWQALDQFPDDTWDGGSLVLSLRLGFDAPSFDVYSFSSGSIITEEHNGFAFVAGNALVMGFEVDKGTFPEGPADIQGRLALDVRTEGFPPQGHRVVTAPAVPFDANGFFPYLGITRVLSPGFPGMLDFTSARLFEGPDGNMLFGLTPRVPWDDSPPMGYFSDFLRVAFAPAGESPTISFGFQTHDGMDETFKDESGSRTASPGIPAFVTDVGDVIIGTDLPVGEGDGYIFVQSGFLVDESSPFQSRTDQFRVSSSEVITDDPYSFGGSLPVYDLATGTELEPPVTTTTVATTTTTTVPVSSGGGDEAASCGWCWTVVIVWALVLVVLIFWRLVKFTWWTCWIAWFLVIVAWVPLLLAGLWFWQPAWWWWPLLAWYPLVLGYGLRWAPSQLWWRPSYQYAVPAYLVVLAVATYLVGRPEWWLLFLLYWVPPLVFYGWARGRLMTWWRPFGFPLLLVHAAFVLVWTRWLTPAWFLWFFAVLIAVLGWWFVVGARRWSLLMGQKWTWILGFVLVPILSFAIALWCSWWCWLTALLFLAWLLLSWRHGFWLDDPAPNASVDRGDTPF